MPRQASDVGRQTCGAQSPNTYSVERSRHGISIMLLTGPGTLDAKHQPGAFAAACMRHVGLDAQKAAAHRLHNACGVDTMTGVVEVAATVKACAVAVKACVDTLVTLIEHVRAVKNREQDVIDFERCVP